MSRNASFLSHRRWGYVAMALLLCVGFATKARAQLDDRDGDGVIECCETGDIICAVGAGLLDQRDPNSGALIRLLNTGSGSAQSTGMCFDAAGDLHTTNFTTSTMSKTDMSSDPVNTNQCGQLIQHPFAGPFNLDPESCVFDSAGDFYVGQADGTGDILKFDATGAPIGSFNPTTGPRGTDWIDLAADQCTIFYTSEGSIIRRFDVCTNTQLPDFATGLPSPCYALRIIPSGPFAGEVLTACSSQAVRVDSTGTIVQNYPTAACAGAFIFFAMNLDPNGTTFWTMDINNGTVCEFDIATGALARTLTCQIQGAGTAGLTVCGELIASTPTDRIEVEKHYSFTGVCFEKDNDADGQFSEDPIDLVDNDNDGLIDEDPVDCPNGTSLGTPLPIDPNSEKFSVKAVTKKNGKVTSYNPGQYYAVSTVEVLVDLDELWISEFYDDCTEEPKMLSALNPPKGGGSVVIVEVGEDGVARQIMDAKSANVTVTDSVPAGGNGVPDNAEAHLNDVPAGHTVLMYVKFGPGLKGKTVPDDPANMCTNETLVQTRIGEAETDASATADLIVLP